MMEQVYEDLPERLASVLPGIAVEQAVRSYHIDLALHEPERIGK